MRILALLGSPRPDGNTQAVLDITLEAARQAGAETEVVHLAGLKNLTGCHECYHCQQVADQPACAIKDDMQPILEAAMKADVTVWAMPVFCWSPAWPAKMAMDRFFCMFKFQDDGSVNCLLKGRKMAAVITAGGGENDGADSVRETCRRMAEYGKTNWLGALLACDVKSADLIRADKALIERARTFGRQLVG